MFKAFYDENQIDLESTLKVIGWSSWVEILCLILFLYKNQKT